MLVSIERDDVVLTPKRESEIQAGNILRVLSRGGFTDSTLEIPETKNRWGSIFESVSE